MARRWNKQSGSDTEKWLEVDASMTGTLNFKDAVNLQINGKFEGVLEAKGNLVIGEQAHVKATIRGESIVVNGTIDGDVVATRLLELSGTARLTGKVSTPRLIISDGAIFQGTLDMNARENNAWMTEQELVRYLEVDAATVSQWAKEGRLPGKKDGNRWKFERSKVEEWLAKEKVK